MTKSLFTLLIAVASLASYGQGSPSLISYQAVLRDMQGSIVSNQEVTVEFAIHQGNAVGLVVFEESHPIVTTTQFGVFTAQIGGGIPTGNGTFVGLEDIPWSENTYFIEVRATLPGQGEPVIIGISQLLSVPYALHSATADQALNESDGSVTNETLSDITFDGINLIFHEGASSFSYNVAALLALVSGDNDPENELIEGVYALNETTLQITEGGNTNSGNVSAISYATWNESDTVVYNLSQRVGVSIEQPTSTFHNNGSNSVAFRMVEGDADIPGPTVDQLDVNDYVLLCNITEEDVTITLPDVTTCAGRVYRIRKFSTSPSSYDVNLVPISGQFIEGNNSLTLGWPLAEYVTVMSTGADWMLIEHSKD